MTLATFPRRQTRHNLISIGQRGGQPVTTTTRVRRGAESGLTKAHTPIHLPLTQRRSTLTFLPVRQRDLSARPTPPLARRGTDNVLQAILLAVRSWSGDITPELSCRTADL
jgi:hypothetical protein